LISRRPPRKRFDDIFGIQDHHGGACFRGAGANHEKTLPRGAELRFRRPPMKSIVKISMIFMFGLLFTYGLSSCSQGIKPVGEAEYATAIVGSWHGRVGDEDEIISFGADGNFVAEVRRAGFISNTLGQGVTGTIRGAWTIKEKVMTLSIRNAEDLRVVNKATTSTIEKFDSDRLVVKSDNGDTATFMRN
jgi:hypothetical protein